MVLTREDKVFLSKATRRDRDGAVNAKTGLSRKDKDRLLVIDELNFMTNGEHLINNFEDLE
ncbi:MAG: hypothetical protein IJO77_04850 [Oscillospiraceae bacterium]|nr:hypothetical protein [Oscillospiraceae bacterium]MBQ9858312.1 hypothetical protein [Oscillospiraceae bacterium]